jgi:hypothetical protein
VLSSSLCCLLCALCDAIEAAAAQHELLPPPAAQPSYRSNTLPRGFLLAPTLPPVAQMCRAIALPARFMLPTPPNGTTFHLALHPPPHTTTSHHHLTPPPHTTTSHHHLTPPPHTTTSHHHLDQKVSLAEVGRAGVADLTCWSHVHPRLLLSARSALCAAAFPCRPEARSKTNPSLATSF